MPASFFTAARPVMSSCANGADATQRLHFTLPDPHVPDADFDRTCTTAVDDTANPLGRLGPLSTADTVEPDPGCDTDATVAHVGDCACSAARTS